ncbi:hypothetical protein ABT373_28440 [Streptomyces sp. NPDC000070]
MDSGGELSAGFDESGRSRLDQPITVTAPAATAGPLVARAHC